MMQLINCTKKPSVLNPKATQLNNMAINGIPNSIPNDSLESIVINVLSKATNVHVIAKRIQRKFKENYCLLY